MKSIRFKTQQNPSTLAFSLIFILAIQNVGSFSLVGNSISNETDRVALLAIKTQLTKHPDSWNNTVHHCHWEGITCGRRHRRVTVLDLSSRGLTGSISPYIGNLSFLRVISLCNNTLYGEIPNQLGNLFRLTELRLQNNTLTGAIPNNISRCVRLRYLYLGFNKLEGKLPVELRALVNLEHFLVKQNNLTGSLFDVVQNLTSLVTLSVALNAFTGVIPNDIGKFRRLTTIAVGANRLSGVVPASVFNLSSIQYLDFPMNQLHGELPANMGFSVPNLQWLNLDGNNFTGSIPISTTNLTRLELLEVWQNGFTGLVPRDFSSFSQLSRLDLSANHLVGDTRFISTLVNCSQLEILSLSGNDFSGILPKSIANLSTTFTFLNVGDNSISGTIPDGVTNLRNIEHLGVYNTRLSGSLPRDLGSLQKLQVLALFSNGLTGTIPVSIGNLSRLSVLYLDNNRFSGRIPESIGNCQSLLYLKLLNNRLSGDIPRELFGGSAQFILVYLSENRLEGSVPVEISKQMNLNDFEVSNNNMSGVFPDSLTACLSLQFLYMDGNSFHGAIPLSLASLAALEEVDISRNHLTGQIPANLSRLPLAYLNLSYNDFEGRVPMSGVFANASGVFLDGNSRLCGGMPVLRLPKCVESEIPIRKNRIKKVVVVSTMCTLVGVSAVVLALYLVYGRKNRRAAVLSTSMNDKTFTKVSYYMLRKVTNGFSSSNLLGTGSFGSVFKGVLDGKMFAVKVLNMQHLGASKSFIAECKALRNIHHRNLVSIITVCSSIDLLRNEFRALVYEFMPNGSLDRWLHGTTTDNNGNVMSLSLAQRVDLAIDVAHALIYLHHECETPIVHCDLKPSNVLLDHDMVAHVGDFGLARFLTQPRHPNKSSSIGIRGTIGYAAPEYGLGSEPWIEGDVYSYGILLLELMTGKSPTDSVFNEGYNLHLHAEAALPDRVLQIVDPTLEEADDDLSRKVECITCVISVGVSCSNHLPHERMKIVDARSIIQGARDNLLNARN